MSDWYLYKRNGIRYRLGVQSVADHKIVTIQRRWFNTGAWEQFDQLILDADEAALVKELL